MYYVYVLQNPDGILYKGFTESLEKRMKQHNANDGFTSFTQKRGPWKLIHHEQFDTVAAARHREKFLKTGKGREYLHEVIERLSAQADG